MMRSVSVAVIATLIAAPLAAQHDHRPAPAPRAAPAPAGAPAAAAAPCPMMGGMSGMMMPVMDSMMASHGMPMMTGMAGMDSMMAPLHALMAFAPRALLERRAELRLDDEQASRLAGIAAVRKPAHDSAMVAAGRHQRALKEALASGSNPAEAAAHFEAMHLAMGTAHAALLWAALESRALLTAGQRSLLEAPAHNHGGGS